MKRFIKELSLSTLIGVTLFLAGISAYLSVFGLSKLFIGGASLLIVGFAALEFIKIIVVSLLNQFWKKFPFLLKLYLLFSIFILMAITSMGIYGYLSSAYTATSLKLTKNEGQIELLEKKDTLFKQEKARYDEIIKAKTERIKTLSKLNISQETRIDSMYNKGLYYNANRIENITAKTTDNITDLNLDIDELNKKSNSIDDSIIKYEMKILELENNDIATDIGPLKYVAESFGLPMDTIVKYLILLFLIVFDPLAIALTIAINILIRKKNENNTPDKDKEEIPNKKTIFSRFNTIKDRIKNKKTENISVNESKNIEEDFKIHKFPIDKSETQFEISEVQNDSLDRDIPIELINKTESIEDIKKIEKGEAYEDIKIPEVIKSSITNDKLGLDIDSKENNDKYIVSNDISSKHNEQKIMPTIDPTKLK